MKLQSRGWNQTGAIEIAADNQNRATEPVNNIFARIYPSTDRTGAVPAELVDRAEQQARLLVDAVNAGEAYKELVGDQVRGPDGWTNWVVIDFQNGTGSVTLYRAARGQSRGTAGRGQRPFSQKEKT